MWLLKIMKRVIFQNHVVRLSLMDNRWVDSISLAWLDLLVLRWCSRSCERRQFPRESSDLVLVLGLAARV